MMMLAINTIIVAMEYSTSSGSMIFSIDSMMMCSPTKIMMIAIIIVVPRSILALYLVNL